MSDKLYTQTGRLMFIIAWLILFILLFLFFRYYKSEQGSYQINHGIVSIRPAEDGHYYIDGRINEYPVKFLVDTGARLVAVPQKIAEQIGLQGQYSITLSTASGEVTGSLTRLKQLSFAGFNLKEVKAVIVPGNKHDLVLLGMNVLANFNLSQEKKLLIIKKE